MEGIIQFFSELPSSVRAAILVGGLVLFWAMEGLIPLFSFRYKKFKHAGINLTMTFFSILVGFGLASLLLQATQVTAANEFGIMYLFDAPLWVEVILGVIFLDLVGAYLIHFVEHKVKFLWQLHLIHHSDTHVDVTTGLRHHPGETVMRILFTTTGVVLLGVPFGVVMLYQSISVLFAHITHANINIPRKIDTVLSYVFVTPHMHKVHHHYKRPLTDTNFGNIFSIWDRLFGTFAYVDETTKLQYGIDTHPEPREHSRVASLLMMPFGKYRPPTTD